MQYLLSGTLSSGKYGFKNNGTHIIGGQVGEQPKQQKSQNSLQRNLQMDTLLLEIHGHLIH